MTKLPPRRSAALKLHVRDLSLQPIKRYVDLQRERGRLLAIGKVDVDLDQMVARRFLCDRHRCIQWSPHEKKADARPLIDNSCCSRYVVPVTDMDRAKVATILPQIRKRLAKDHPLVRDKDESPFDLDEEYAFVMKDLPSGACQFVVYDKGLTSCAIHKTCLEEGLDPWEYKPLGCSLWPLALVDYDDDGQERFLLTVYAEATAGIFSETDEGERDDEKRFACLVDNDPAYEPMYRSCEDVLVRVLGAAFYRQLDQKARRYLSAHAKQAERTRSA
jgi:hypothetical protein